MEKKQFYHLVEHFPDGILIFRGGSCSYINETGVNLLGGSDKESFAGKSLYDFTPESNHERVERRLNRIKREDVLGPVEGQLICSDGDLLDVEVSVLQTVYEENEELRLIFRDIRNRKKAEAFLLNSEKMMMAGQLSAKIADEVKPPLTALKGFFQIMEHDIKEKKPYLDVIYSEINRIEIILSELLVLANPQETQLERNELETILDEVITLFKTRAGMENVKLKTMMEDNFPAILCDKNQLKQVFLQLLQNAAEALPDDGKVSLQAERYSSDRIVIHFTDSGCGIAEEELKRLGEPFFTTKENAAGLGLMMAYRIIENHNGSIRIASGPWGTTVGVILPILHA